MPIIVFHSPNFWTVLLVMLAGGIIGGFVNYLLNPTPPTNTKLPDNAPDPATSTLPNPPGEGATSSGNTGATDSSPTPLPSGPPYWLRCIGVGIGAALIVPIFLYLTRSELLSDLKLSAKLVPVQTAPPNSTTAKSPDSTSLNAATSADSLTNKQQAARRNSPPASTTVAAAPPQVSTEDVVGAYLVFFGLCVLAAISGFNFIPAMGSRILAMVNQANETAKKANEKSDDAQKKVDQSIPQIEKNKEKNESQEGIIRGLINKANIQPATPGPDANVLTTRDTSLSFSPQELKRTQLIKDRLALPDAFPKADDPQKGRWGGKPDSDHYQLKATVTPIDKYGRYCDVTLWVEAKDPVRQPLTGDVSFFIHPTFGKSQLTAPVQTGHATVKLWAYGTFTAGAVTEDAEMMELDIANVVAGDTRISDDFRNS
jgi:hypothetical protein